VCSHNLSHFINLVCSHNWLQGKSGLVISRLQYASNTLFVEEASFKNLWTIKMIVYYFELALRLLVKPRVWGVVDRHNEYIHKRSTSSPPAGRCE